MVIAVCLLHLFPLFISWVLLVRKNKVFLTAQSASHFLDTTNRVLEATVEVTEQERSLTHTGDEPSWASY